jgi:hypothetical protein
MYRITCYCGKTDFYRTETIKSWVNRKCKKCKSNFIVYQNETIVLNYNNKKDRQLNRVKKSKATKQVPSVFNQIPFQPFQPIFFQMPYVPILPKPLNPVKSDVFMGYQGKFFVMTPTIENYPKDMEIDIEVKDEKHEFEFNL